MGDIQETWVALSMAQASTLNKRCLGGGGGVKPGEEGGAIYPEEAIWKAQ